MSITAPGSRHHFRQPSASHAGSHCQPVHLQRPPGAPGWRWSMRTKRGKFSLCMDNPFSHDLCKMPIDSFPNGRHSPDALSSAKGRPSTAAPRGTSGTAMVFPSCNVAAAFLGRGEIGWVRRSGACVAAGALANGRPPDVAPPCRCLSTHCDGVHGRIPPCFARAPLALSLLLPHAHGVFAAPGPCGALRLFGCEALLFFRCRALGRARLAHPLPLLVSTEPPGSGRFLCVYSPSFPW